MNTNLITLSEVAFGAELKQTVNGRELHGVLEVNKDFSSWVKNQIERARLIEGRDYIKLTQNGELTNQQVTTTVGNKIEYFFIVDAAKHIAMLCGTDKGFEVREYFIECEKQLKEVKPMTQGQMLVQMALAYEAHERELLRLDAEQKLLKSENKEIIEEQRVIKGKLEDFSTGAEHFSITAYAKIFRNGYQISNSEANSDGRKMSKMAKNMGIKLGLAPHPIFGTVNTYPKALLDEFYRGEIDLFH